MNDAAVWVPVPAMFYWGWLVPLIFGTIFGWRYHRDKVRLGNGIWFSLFFYSFLTMLAITILDSNIHWLIIISGTLFVLLILLIGLIFTLQAFLLLWNAWIMWRHESHTLANMLTLYLGLAILILPFLGNLLSSHVPQPVSYFWKTLQQNRYDYAAEIEGESMEPKFHDGDIALIRKTHVNDYDGCVCVVDDVANQRVYIKRIHIEDTHVRLESLNKDTYDNGELIYPDILLENNENLKLIGKVVDSFKPIEIK